MAAVDVVTEIRINRPVDEVSRFAADPNKATKWYTNIKSVVWKTAPPLNVGTQIEFIAEFLGKRIIYTYEVEEYIISQKLVMRTSSGPFPMETTYDWDRISATETHMKLRNRGNPSGFSNLIAPFMAMAMRKENARDLKRLKIILEANSRSTS